MTLDRLVDEILKTSKRPPSFIQNQYSSLRMTDSVSCTTDPVVHASIIRNEIKQMIQEYALELARQSCAIERLVVEQKNATAA